MSVTARLTGINELVAKLSALPDRPRAGVKVLGKLNAIKAAVWDLGYVTRVIKPGPKTLWSVNVYGDPKVLTITAPTGFIRVQRQAYLAVLRDEFVKARFNMQPIDSWPILAEIMMRNAAQRCADLVAKAAPIDTGDLRNSIVPAFPGDPALSGSDAGFDVGDFLE